MAIAAIIIFIHFTAKLFVLRKNAPGYHKALHWLSVACLVVVPLSYFLAPANVWLLTQVLTCMAMLGLLFIARQLSDEHKRLSGTYSLMLWLQLVFNVISYTVNFTSTHRHSTIVDMLAFWLMAIMVTYLMGRKYTGHIRDEKLAQQQVLQSAKASESAQRELLALQQEGQEQLEFSVQERTIELHIALQELEDANQELKEKNTLDSLSGLYNRRYYDEKIMAEFRRSRRNLTPLSLVVIDIDHFKKVNDSHGHLVGDKCIVAVAKMIKTLLRRSADVGCRYGGEEFCLILPETDSHGAVTLAEEICQGIRQQPITDGENVIELTLSCGITTYQQEKDVTSEVMFANADKALYRAKQAGRDQVQVAEA
ncbi:MAG: GGDEF domain-containing protein [Cognaticolwellia sp.]